MNIEIKNIWRKKSWSIPDLLGSKSEYTKIVVGLINQIACGNANSMDEIPQIEGVSELRTWREYAPFLKGIGIVRNYNGMLCLSETGEKLYNDLSLYNIASVMQDRFRIFGEILRVLDSEPSTVQEVDEKICNLYKLAWNNCSNTRKRMDWLEVLGLIDIIGNRKWIVTESGKRALKEWALVTPEMLESFEETEVKYKITEAPVEISNMLQELSDNNTLHKERCTYNLWAPSPNKIENLRKILKYSCEKVSRAELFGYIGEEFNLKVSSVESMMPFLKASGLLEEVGRNIYVTSSVAKEWCETGADIDLIRILHCHYRFVGEMIIFAENDVTRNEIYQEAKKYGLNNEKARWIAGFLIEAGLLEEPQYLHLKASAFGIEFAKTLPLTDEHTYVDEYDSQDTVGVEVKRKTSEDDLFEKLSAAAIDPLAEGKASGVAFEEEIAKVFRYMGFEAKRIGGSGNTDVIVRWCDGEGKTIIGIVDAKSKSNGQVSHNDVSDVAIDTHKEKNHADYVAIVGAGFSGDTIKNFALKKNVALITVQELIDIAKKAKELGLNLHEIALLFQSPDGLSKLEELISIKQREQNLIKQIVATFKKEQELLESISARDMFLLLRMTDNSPSLEEILNVFTLLSTEEINVLKIDKKAPAEENTTYTMKNAKATVNRLKMIANAIEKGIDK